jgi:hypothetical protein
MDTLKHCLSNPKKLSHTVQTIHKPSTLPKHSIETLRTLPEKYTETLNTAETNHRKSQHCLNNLKELKYIISDIPHTGKKKYNKQLVK